jgi:hypothetical protein
MPRSSSPKIPERKITTVKQMPLPFDRNLPAIIPQRPSFLQTMKEGVALGVGSSLGHRLVGAIMGPTMIQKAEQNKEEYDQCMKDNNDKAGCEHLRNK